MWYVNAKYKIFFKLLKPLQHLLKKPDISLWLTPASVYDAMIDDMLVAFKVENCLKNCEGKCNFLGDTESGK